MIISIQTAVYIKDYQLHLIFDNGESGDVDLKDFIFKYSVALPLREIENFKAFKLDEWSTVTWDCGFDVSPETLYERATGKKIHWQQTELILATES